MKITLRIPTIVLSITCFALTGAAISGAQTNPPAGDIERPLADYDRAIEQNPKDARAFVGRGNIKADKGDKEGAMADYNRAIELDPKYARAYLARGNIKSDQGDKEGAMADYSHAIQLDPKYVNAFYERGREEEQNGELDKALADFSRVIELAPKDSDAYAHRGSCEQDKGDKAAALADYNRAIQLDPKNSYAFWNRGRWRLGANQVRFAIVDFDTAIRLGENFPGVYFLRGLAHSHLADDVAQPNEKRGYHEAAIEDFSQSIQLTPTAECFSFRSAEYEQLKQYDKALGDAEDAVRLDSKGAYCFYQRGWMYRRTGQESLAIKDFRRASELDPGNKDYAGAARQTEEKEHSSELTTGQKIAAGIVAVGAGYWLLNKAFSHDEPKSQSQGPHSSSNDGWKKVRCRACNGSGVISKNVTTISGEDTGFPDFINNKCPKCNGKGWVEERGNRTRWIKDD